jgi:hypothetical protein
MTKDPKIVYNSEDTAPMTLYAKTEYGGKFAIPVIAASDGTLKIHGVNPLVDGNRESVAVSDETTTAILTKILKELQKMNFHLEDITNLEMKNYNVGE